MTIHNPEPLRRFLLSELGNIKINLFFLANNARQTQSQNMGRKTLPDSQKKQNFSITFSPAAVKVINRNTKNQPRSLFVEKAVLDYSKRKKI